jgi:hypothetical protein
VVSCAHRCCTISGNAYHRHRSPPDLCARCQDQLDEEEVAELADIVGTVIDRIAPAIPGLPSDPDALLDLVLSVTTDVYTRSWAEGQLQGLAPGRRRTVLAARVGIALAFPARG